MTCDRIQERFADFLTGELDASARREVQDHIAACAPCRTEIEELTATWARLDLLPAEQPSGRVRSGFYEMLERYKDGLERRASGRRFIRHFAAWWEKAWLRKPAFATALALALIVVGIGAGYGIRGGGGGREITALRDEVRDMRQTVALSLLNQSSAVERLQGVNYTQRIDRPDNRTLDALFETLNSDPNVNVRLAAVDALYLFREQPGVKESLAASLAGQRASLVQVALIDLLVEVREARAAESLKALIEGGELDPAVKARAEQGLKELI
ncbi:MAG: zf-HC2 domain-containing protein [Candidatus Aminicenantes bacterium]|nr:zf-HC2 domain-containing protein [Candidatus Aminicenantes bacterium]